MTEIEKIKIKELDIKELNSSVKKWYIKRYSKDKDIWENCSDSLSFYHIADALNNYKDVYDYIPCDSVVRERVFEQLSRILKCSYVKVYDKWLDINKENKEMLSLNCCSVIFDFPKHKLQGEKVFLTIDKANQFKNEMLATYGGDMLDVCFTKVY